MSTSIAKSLHWPFVASSPKLEADEQDTVLWGKLAGFAASELLAFIQQTRRTGTLWIDAPDFKARLGFYQGELINATSDTSPKLGDALVECGVVEQDDIDAALEDQRRAIQPRNLGRCLQDMGTGSQSEVLGVIKQLTQETVSRLFACKEGAFELTVGPPPGFGQYDLLGRDCGLKSQQISTTGTLLEAARQIDQAKLEQTPESNVAISDLIDDVVSRLENGISRDGFE